MAAVREPRPGGQRAGNSLTPPILARGTRGAVVAPHHLATTAGLSVLQRGGHAVDAAIAANAVLGVVMPDACGIGGDAFWLIWDQRSKRQFALNGSGAAGSSANAEALRARGMTRIPALSPESITVPGAVHSWAEAHRRFGRIACSEVLGAAIDMANDGYAAWPGFIAAVEELAPEIESVYGPQAAFFEVFRPAGRPWRPGERVRLPALANTLRRLAESGLSSFYADDLASRQTQFLGLAGASIIRRDIEGHTSTWSDPITTSYRGVRVTTHPPNSQGVIALEILNILERFDPPEAQAFGARGLVDPRWIHAGVEAAKIAVQDRDAYLGDPAFIDPQIDRLLSKDYAATRAAKINLARASFERPTETPSGGGTVYIAAVDSDGNAVSLIQSNYFRFGSGLVDRETGIVYQDRGCYFRLEPGHPNELQPGKRPLHTLLPGMLFRDDQAPWVVLGSMGGDAQTQVHAQIVSALVDGNLDVAAAVAAPRWFARQSDRNGLPDELLAEPRFPPGVLSRLKKMGHHLVPTELMDERVGHAHAIELVEGGPASVGGSLAATTDPRSAGLPAVW